LFAFHPTPRSFHHRLSAVTGALLLLAGLFPAALVAPAAVRAAPTDLFFSEYIEGSSNNKALEIFNGTGAPVDLAAGGYSVQMFFNGSSSAGLTFSLTGTVADGDVFVVAHSSASPTILAQADMTNGAGWFNGDDAVVLAKGSATLDVIGQVGFDPGSEWGAGVTSTQDNTLRRKGAIQAGDPDGSDAFDPAAEWDGFAQDTFDGLGSHSISSEPDEARLVINEIDYDQPGTDAAEFVEIANAGTLEATLDGTSLVLVNGNGGGAAAYQTFNLPAGTLAAGGYFVVCANAANTSNCDLDVTPDTNLIQNGAPDAVALLVDGELVDAVSYEGDSGAPYTEGSGMGLVDDPSLSNASIGRCPDGGDTDQNNADFTFQPATPGAANDCAGAVVGSCGEAATAIHAIQGSGSTSLMVGSPVVVEAVVVGDFQNNASPDSGELSGFYLQEADADADANPATSEGIFVFAPGADDVAVGDRVRVAATVSEYTTSGGSSQTELSGVSAVVPCASGVTLPAPTAAQLPFTALDDPERYEGMLVTFPQALSISEFFNFDRFDEVVLTAGRQFQPTAVAEPGPDAQAVAEANALNRITLDDGRTNQNPVPLRHPDGEQFTLSHRFRGGDTVTNVTGVIDESFGLYRIQPVADADYTEVNPRPAAPEDVGGSLHVASFNVLNYFTTIDTGPSGPLCGPHEDQECRGADNAGELARQRAKIVAALSTMNADVVGLIEIENNPGDGPTADLVAGLNDVLGAGTYDYVATGAIGTDAIRVAMIYKPASVTPLGAFAILDTSVDPRFDDTRNRPVLAQSFEEVTNGGIFTLAVNHLKSKGSDCSDSGIPGDDDPQQGNCNVTRTRAAEALADWLATDPTGSGDRDALIMGDLNSYDHEDPIGAIREGADDATGTNDDFTDLIHAYQGELAYSYLFDGQLGYLDTALASGTIAPQVSGATVWHINADEPDILDYDTSFKPAEQAALYEPNAYRSSDHDPVIVGLDLQAFDFDALQPPIDPTALNEVKAGSTVPIKFGLGGDFGLDVLFEVPQVFACGDWPSGVSIDAQSPGRAMLSYDADQDQYVFTWKTSKQWSGSCRTLELTLTDGTYVTASFDFVR
jgi:predicted extracellular nuclease